MMNHEIKILIVTQKFFPHGDATSAVVGNLSDALTACGCQIDLLALTDREEDVRVTQWHDVHVKQFFVEELISRKQLLESNDYQKVYAGNVILKKCINKVLMRIGTYKRLSLDPIQLKVYQNALTETLSGNAYDMCLVTLAPINAVRAVFSMATRPAIAVYQLDTYWNNDALPIEFRTDRLQYETEIVYKSAFVLTTPIVEKANRQCMPDFSDKMIAAEFPMIKEEPEIFSNKKDEFCHCVFTGAFYPDIRPPEKVVGLIAGLKKGTLVFDFYGEKQELVQAVPAYSAAKDKILLKGPVTSEAALHARVAADILVNIDNTTLTQVPSKIFEYISLGKPIINLYFNQNSPTLAYLQRYPLCLNIQLDDAQMEKNIHAIEVFAAENKEKKIPFEEIKRIYYQNTPEYVAEQLLNAYEHFQLKQQKER